MNERTCCGSQTLERWKCEHELTYCTALFNFPHHIAASLLSTYTWPTFSFRHSLDVQILIGETTCCTHGRGCMINARLTQFFLFHECSPHDLMTNITESRKCVKLGVISQCYHFSQSLFCQNKCFKALNRHVSDT